VGCRWGIRCGFRGLESGVGLVVRVDCWGFLITGLIVVIVGLVGGFWGFGVGGYAIVFGVIGFIW